jgi:putative tryptophan/tyrosine transport system substrate-binding protein
MIDRRLFIGVLVGSVLAAPFVADAQPAEKVWRIGYLGTVPAGASPESDRIFAAFIQGLEDNGFVESRNFALERRAMEGRVDRAPALVAELIRLHVDILVVATVAAARAAKEATTSTPIVMLHGNDPVASGLVASLARPGGNVTGVTDFNDDLNPKRLELLKTAAPKAVRIAFIQPDYTGRFDAAQLEALNQEYDVAARTLGVSLRRVPLKNQQDFETASAAIVRERADAMLIDDGAITYLLRKQIADFAIRHRLPSIVANRSALTGGALMSYGPDMADNWRKAASYVAKILKGAKPAALPVERPTKVELVINQRTAAAIGITIPQALLLRADEVIR